MKRIMGWLVHRISPLAVLLLLGASVFLSSAQAQRVQITMKCEVSVASTISKEQVEQLPITGRSIPDLILRCPGVPPPGSSVDLHFTPGVSDGGYIFSNTPTGPGTPPPTPGIPQGNDIEEYKIPADTREFRIGEIVPIIRKSGAGIRVDIKGSGGIKFTPSRLTLPAPPAPANSGSGPILQFQGFSGPAVLPGGHTVFEGGGGISFLLPVTNCIHFGPMIEGGGLGSATLIKLGGPTGGSLPSTFENLTFGFTLLNFGARTQVQLRRRFSLALDMGAVEVFARQKTVGGTCIVDTCTPSFTATSNMTFAGIFGGASLSRTVWSSDSAQLDAFVGYRYDAARFPINEATAGVKLSLRHHF